MLKQIFFLIENVSEKMLSISLKFSQWLQESLTRLPSIHIVLIFLSAWKPGLLDGPICIAES